MHRHLLSQRRLARLGAATTSCAILAFALCGCQTTASNDGTGSIGDKADPTLSPDAARHQVDADRERYRANPKDPAVALQYAKALRAAGERTQAVAVLEQAVIANPVNKKLLGGS